MAAMPPRERLLTPRFLLVVAAGLSYFMAIGMLIPVIPRYVKGPLAGGNVGVGVAVGSLFVGAVLLRPYAGRVGDRFGRDRFLAAWIVSASLALFAAALGTITVEVARTLPRGPAGKLLHRAALAPGVVLFLGLIGLAGFTAFVPLYVRELDLGGADTLFLLYGGLILCVRIVGARLPDILGGRRAATIALTCGATGLALMAAWPSVAGLVAGTAVFAAGMSLLYPALLVLALTAVPDNERGSVVGTFSSFFDLSQGIGALILGGVAALSGYRGAFAGGAIAAGVGVVLLTTGVGLRAQASGARERARSEAVPA